MSPAPNAASRMVRSTWKELCRAVPVLRRVDVRSAWIAMTNVLPSNEPWPRPIPDEFDPVFYRAANKQLAGLSDDEARAHYAETGRAEGLAGSQYALRDGLLKFARGANSVLEIGPGHRPCFTGPKVRYFDVTDNAGLRARVAHKPDEHVGAAPKIVHYVSPTGDLGVVPETFDVVFSSHAIEHQPDLIRHLQAVRRLLNPGGAYIALVPDRRYCFDQFQPRSTLGQVIEAFRQERRTHSIANVIDANILGTHNDPLRHWAGDSPETPLDVRRARHALKTLEQAGGDYLDVHAWRFSSEEMRDTLNMLRALDLIAFDAIRVFSTPRDSGEFALILA